jgi:hypothetical protein
MIVELILRKKLAEAGVLPAQEAIESIASCFGLSDVNAILKDLILTPI